MKKPLLNNEQRLMMLHFPKSLTASAGHIEIAKKKFAREFSKAINESAFMIWLGLKLR